MSTPKPVNAFAITTGGNESDARVAVLANGDIAVAYYDNGEARVGLFAPDGSALNDVLISSISGLIADISIAALPDGQYVVAVAFDSGLVFGGIGNSAGLSAGVTPYLSIATEPRVTVLANGNFVMAWQQGDDIGFQIYQPDGTPVGSAETISTVLPVARPEITALAGGGFVIVGTVDDNNGDPYHFIYDENGVPRSTGPDTFSAHVETDAFAFGLANGDFVTVYTNATGGDGDAGGIFFALNDDGGDAVGPPVFLANTGVAGNQHDATGVGLRDGGFVIAWKDDDSAYIHAQAFDSDGQPRGYEFEVGGGFSTVNDQVSVAEMADGRIVFTWRQNDLGETTIHSRTFDPREAAITLNGTTFDDQYVGTVFADTIRGQRGADELRGGGGDD
nr:hypothetical protein [Bauldia sp.]